MRLQLATFVGMTALGIATTAGAMSECRMNARAVFQDCKDACKDDFVQAKLICRNVSPECGLGCLAARGTCRDNVRAILATGQLPGGGTLDNCSTGTDGCDAALLQGRQGCWAQYCAPNETCNSCGDTHITDHNACYECVDPFQVTAFICRDTCRDSYRQNQLVQDLKKNCQDIFVSCISVCPPATP